MLSMEPSSASSQTAVFIVSPEQAGKRLDVFLVSQLPAFSRTQVQALITAGDVSPLFPVKAVRSNLIVLEGQKVQVTVPASKKSDILAQKIPLDIVFEDDSVLVIDKPVGLVVHPGAGNPSRTLLNALMAHCPNIAGVGGVQRPGLVHRLDKDTSGLLVVAKSDLAYRSLVRQLKTRSLSREYLGIVKGTLEDKGTVDAAIGRHASARKKMAVRAELGKPSITHFVSMRSNEEVSLLHLKLETGRTHQIRVHLSYIHHPILGDSIYGGESDLAGRQMLHAFRLSFKHPKTGITRSFYAAPPEDFLKCLKKTGLKAPRWASIRWKS
jgi:23S rRNA pseudouridine1911/1915/1917 synthase